jgi:hypothetical protein
MMNAWRSGFIIFKRAALYPAGGLHSEIRGGLMTKHFLIGAMIAAVPALTTAQTKDDLIGTWKLMTARSIRANGDSVPMFGEHPTGFLTYTREGRMIAILADGDRKQLSADRATSPVAERAAAFSDCLAYAGPSASMVRR